MNNKNYNQTAVASGLVVLCFLTASCSEQSARSSGKSKAADSNPAAPNQVKEDGSSSDDSRPFSVSAHFASIKKGDSISSAHDLIGQPDKVVVWSGKTELGPSLRALLYRGKKRLYVLVVSADTVLQKKVVTKATLDDLLPGGRPNLRTGWTTIQQALPPVDQPVFVFKKDPEKGKPRYTLAIYDRKKKEWYFENPQEAPKERLYFDGWGSSIRCALESTVHNSKLQELWKFWYETEPSEPLQAWSEPPWIVRDRLKKQLLFELDLIDNQN